MSHDAFISYSTHDKTAADAACVALEAAGIRCWIAPRDIMPGTEWREAIVEAINHCRVMILIFPANTNDSQQIRREVERAVSNGVSVIPLRIEAHGHHGGRSRQFPGARGLYRTVDAKTGRVRTGTYRAVSNVVVALTPDGGYQY